MHAAGRGRKKDEIQGKQALFLCGSFNANVVLTAKPDSTENSRTVKIPAVPSGSRRIGNRLNWPEGVRMSFELPQIVDFGSIATHTFTNTGIVPGVGPKGKDKNGCATLDKFDEPSCSGDHGLS